MKTKTIADYMNEILDMIKKLLHIEELIDAMIGQRSCEEIDLPDSVPGMTVKAPELPKVEIPEDWDI